MLSRISSDALIGCLLSDRGRARWGWDLRISPILRGKLSECSGLHWTAPVFNICGTATSWSRHYVCRFSVINSCQVMQDSDLNLKCRGSPWISKAKSNCLSYPYFLRANLSTVILHSVSWGWRTLFSHVGKDPCRIFSIQLKMHPGYCLFSAGKRM